VGPLITSGLKKEVLLAASVAFKTPEEQYLMTTNSSVLGSSEGVNMYRFFPKEDEEGTSNREEGVLDSHGILSATFLQRNYCPYL
jgi:hypothetical protein